MVQLVARGRRRRWMLIGDDSYAYLRLGRECLSAQAGLISRLRLEARLFAPPSPVPPGRSGPKPLKGQLLAKLATRLEGAAHQGTATTVQWYRGEASIIIPPGARPGSAGVPPARGPEARAPRKLAGVMIMAALDTIE